MRNPFNSFPSSRRERKAAVEDSEDATYLFKRRIEKRRDNNPYNWIDSPADGEYIDGLGMPFFESFKDIMPSGEISIVKYIEKSLSGKDGKAVGIEFGGVGSRFFNSFSPGFFSKSVGVSLVELRKQEDVTFSQEYNERINHEVIMGDIFDHKTYELVKKSLGGAKVDLIISRMGKGLQLVPKEPYKVSNILQIWYKMLSEEGIMLVQTPVFFNQLLVEWGNKITEEYKDVLNIQYKLGNYNGVEPCSAFRIRKLPGAPLELPLLDPRTVRNAYPFHEDL